MDDEIEKTIKIRRDSNVGTDSKGRTVWTKPIEPVELELVSTTVLEKLLESGDETQRQRIRKFADGENGFLARDPTNDQLEMISDAEVEAALQAASRDDRGNAPIKTARSPTREPAKSETQSQTEGLSLVTTQMLRQMLEGDVPAEPDDREEQDTEKKGGYNPYDRG